MRAWRVAKTENLGDVETGERMSLTLSAEDDPLRLGLDWERRADERLVGLGLRHHPRLDQETKVFERSL